MSTLANNTETQELVVLGAKGAALKMRADALQITNQATFDEAGAYLVAIKSFRAMVGELFDPQIKSAHESHQTALKQKKRFDDPLLQADTVFRRKMSDYVVEQKRLEELRQKLADDEARKKEEDLKADLVAKATQAEAAGQTEEAAELREEAKEIFVPAAPVEPTVEAPAGISVPGPKDYEVKIVNSMALIKALASGAVEVPDLDALITWKITPLKNLARETEGAPIPGCTVTPKVAIRASGKF